MAISAIGRMELWQEWINLALGAWIFAAPWAFGFAWASLPAAAWDHWIVGALIFLISAWNVGALQTDGRRRVQGYGVGRPGA